MAGWMMLDWIERWSIVAGMASLFPVIVDANRRCPGPRFLAVDRSPEDPLDMLSRRLASGEISVDDYERLRAVLTALLRSVR